MKLQELLEQFDWDSLKTKYTSTETTHKITASNGSGAVGYIEWNNDDGELEKIFVGDKIRRLGIGTFLWNTAVEWAEKNNAVLPEHSDARTRDGDAFANAIGGYIPSIRDDVDGWMSEDYQPLLESQTLTDLD